MENCSILNDESKGRMLAAPQQYGMTAERKGAADDFGNRMVIRQEIRGTDAVVEMCGCDVKNRYAVEAGIRQYYISEESNCFERFLCKCQRSLTFRLHDGPTADHPILYHFEKPCHCQIVCCGSLRPTMTVLDQKSNRIGRVHDPCRCCVLDNDIFDVDDRLSYVISGSVCQIGLCCPCGPASYQIKSGTGIVNPSGLLTKEFNGLAECCLKANMFAIDFPPNAPLDHKALILGSVMLIDLQYFERR
eukprot:GEMP01071304.1.p1 GENE.GEMP01071304.1~~GEMP01071304.1.p1  ORF type:complete len:247 (+),score=43.97 GEMP01071304.1:222-962(+)